MKPPITHFHIAISIIIVFACGFIVISYGRIAFATFTERPGLNGDWYNYYHTNRMVFTLYNLAIAAGALWTVLSLFFALYRSDRKRLTKTFTYFFIFLVIIILCEIYLNTRFVEKG